MSLIAVFEKFPDHASCIAHLEQVRWGDEPVCPLCGATEVGRKQEKGRVGRWNCYACHSSYNVLSGTLFERTRVPLQKWFLAIILMLNTKASLSSHQLARDLELNQKTAWFMMMRIRKGMEQDSAFLKGVVEADETYISWQKRSKRGDKLDNGEYDRNWKRYKMTMMGAVERDGDVFAQLIDGVTGTYLTPFLTRNVALSAQLVTDGLTGYSRMGNHFASHHVLEHNDTYVEGEVHTNTIEGFWKQLKRAWYGTHTKYSPAYANAYAAEGRATSGTTGLRMTCLTGFFGVCAVDDGRILHRVVQYTQWVRPSNVGDGVRTRNERRVSRQSKCRMSSNSITPTQ